MKLKEEIIKRLNGLTRYELISSYEYGYEKRHVLVLYKDGEWIKYEEIEQLIKDLENV